MAEKISSMLEGWTKWQIALAVGAPVALGVAGLWYYKRGQSPNQIIIDDKAEKKENKAEPQLSLQEKALAAKSKGNKYFKGGKYEQAIQCYTEAINLCPKEHGNDLSTFYQNRAAAQEQLQCYKSVIDDCTKALEFNDKYSKALFRRAKAYETTGNLMGCLEDVTAVCIVENFQNQQSLLMADRVLKELGKSKAKIAIQNKKPVEPSPQFIRTYFSAFCNDPIFNFEKSKTEVGSPDSAEGSEISEPEKHTDETPEKEMIGDGNDNSKNEAQSPFQKARQCLRNKNYSNVVSLCTEEIDNAESRYIAEALLLRATFYLLSGEGNRATADLDKLLDLTQVDKRIRSNALIKRGSLKMQNGEQSEALQDFSKAVEEDAENSDIYHHRGQLNLLIENVEDAVKDFNKSVELSPKFAIAHVQKCYTEYRLAVGQQSPLAINHATRQFEQTIGKFPDCSEGYALFGQALCDQQMFEKADENFQKALKLEPENGNIYVHRGLLRLQWKQDIDEAARLIKKALEVDTKCEFAYETLGTIEVQRGNLDQAMTLFNKAIELAKTEVEMAHLYSLLDAAIAQSRVAHRFGITVPTMGM